MGASPAPPAACIDLGPFGDSGEFVVVAFAGLDTAIKASNKTDAQTSAKTAATGVRSLAKLVDTVAPEAQKEVLSAADALDRAGPKLPNAATQVAQANTDFNHALDLARAMGC